MKKQIAVFGGCFNPPLNSHFSLAEQILNEHEEVEKILFVPVSNKYNKKGLIEDKHRYNMLKLICDKNPRFAISRIEMDNERQLFTIETLLELQKEYSDFELVFITGSDNLKELEKWQKADELVEKFKLLIFIFAWRYAIMLFKNTVEIGEVVKSYLFCNTQDGRI